VGLDFAGFRGVGVDFLAKSKWGIHANESSAHKELALDFEMHRHNTLRSALSPVLGIEAAQDRS
jgi:hypothetical protein